MVDKKNAAPVAAWATAGEVTAQQGASNRGLPRTRVTAPKTSGAKAASSTKVTPRGQMAALGVCKGWRLNGFGEGAGGDQTDYFSVAATTAAKDIVEALATARKKAKPYTLEFSVEATGGSGVEGKVEQEGRGESGKGGSGDDLKAADKEAGKQSAHEASNDERAGGRGGENKMTDDKRSLPGAAGSKLGTEVGGGSNAGEDGGVSVEVSRREPAAASGDGEVTLMYEMYAEKFRIKGGCLSSADIDETYCLSFVMPNCTLHLGPMSPSDRYARENDGQAVAYLPGIFRGLVDGGVYWVYVSRDDEEEKRDRERMKQVVKGMQQDLAAEDAGGGRKDDGRNGLESCSCVYGNPCVDEYGCRDWHSRYAVARANGWKGF